jgi:hypothetical protein
MDFSHGNFKYIWEYDWADTIRYHIAKLEPKPRYLIFNAGIWPHDLTDAEVVREIRQALDDTGMVGIYKTTTASRGANIAGNNLSPYEQHACKIFQYCLNLSWTEDVPYDQYWDRLHFVARPYNRMNEQLLDLLKEIESTDRTAGTAIAHNN